MAVHNSLGARQLYDMGFKRVVLAREMSLEEIAAVRRSCPIELEVFVHGALCYSYSGLCLFSSYLGGRGSTRGRCTQPCRRRYKTGKHTGYFFSPSDLSAIDILPELKELGVKAVKIEGRMRSATYVASVVKAYRLALDALETDDSKAIDQAKRLIEASMGRRLSNGFYRPDGRKDILAPHISGNIGQWIGTVKQGGKNEATIYLKRDLSVGDRIRAHFPDTDERKSLTLRKIEIGGKSAITAEPGQTVTMTLPFCSPPRTAFFKVDSKSHKTGLSRQKIWETIKRNIGDKTESPRNISVSKIHEILSSYKRQGHPSKKSKELFTLRFNLKQPVIDAISLSGYRTIMTLSKNDWRYFSKMLPAYQRVRESVYWSLPPIIREKDISFFQKLIRQLLKKGFRNWEITNLGHLQFFKKSDITLQAGPQLNLLNSWAFKAVGWMGISFAVVSIEADRNDIKDLLLKNPLPAPVMTIYGHPPLFTSRLIPKRLKHGQSIASIRKERFRISLDGDISYLVPQQAFSLVPFQRELSKMGCRNFIIDLSREAKPTAVLFTILKKRCAQNCSYFNYKRGLQ
jgi:putative protease